MIVSYFWFVMHGVAFSDDFACSINALDYHILTMDNTRQSLYSRLQYIDSLRVWCLGLLAPHAESFHVGRERPRS